MAQLLRNVKIFKIGSCEIFGSDRLPTLKDGKTSKTRIFLMTTKVFDQ
jgi:hypothetical protein